MVLSFWLWASRFKRLGVKIPGFGNVGISEAFEPTIRWGLGFRVHRSPLPKL